MFSFAVQAFDVARLAIEAIGPGYCDIDTGAVYLADRPCGKVTRVSNHGTASTAIEVQLTDAEAIRLVSAGVVSYLIADHDLLYLADFTAATKSFAILQNGQPLRKRDFVGNAAGEHYLLHAEHDMWGFVTKQSNAGQHRNRLRALVHSL